MEALLHFTIVFVALVLLGVEPRIGAPLGLFALLPDIDFLLGIHRSFLHSLIVLLALGVPLAVVLRRTDLGKYAPLALVAAASNPIIDSFYGYTPLFWPLSDSSLWIRVGLSLQWGEVTGVENSTRIMVKPTEFVQAAQFEGPLLTSEGLIISAFLIIPIAIKILRRREG